jgi:hypothetical protein
MWKKLLKILGVAAQEVGPAIGGGKTPGIISGVGKVIVAGTKEEEGRTDDADRQRTSQSETSRSE